MVDSYWTPFKPDVFGPEPMRQSVFALFDSIKTESDYLAYIEENPFLMRLSSRASDVLKKEQSMDDYYDMRRAIDAATLLKAISAAPELFAEQGPRAGVSLEHMTLSEFAGDAEAGAELAVCVPKITLELNGRSYLRYLLWAALRDAAAFEAPIEDLAEALNAGGGGIRSLTVADEGNASLTLSASSVFMYEPETPEDHQAAPLETLSEIALSLFDALCNTNLAGIEAREIGGRLQRYADKGAALLWLSFCEEIDAARVALCPVCGRPLVISGERGTPREYCGQACRVWRRRHPGETREPKVTLKKR